MNTFAGNITFKGIIDTSKIQGKYLSIVSEGSESTTLFVFGKTKLDSSETLLQEYASLGEVLFYDLSLSTEDRIVLLNNEIDSDGLYEVVSFEAPEIDFRNIIERFEESFEVISIREAEESEKFGNRVIKVDFIY